MKRLGAGEAVAGEARELAALRAAGVVRDRQLCPVRESCTAEADPACDPLLHDREQLDQPAQATVVLRLLGQMRKPARQQPRDQTKELAVRADPDRGLRDRESNQLRVRDQRRPATTGRHPILVSEDVRCNDKGFQIRHLELLSRGDKWTGSPSLPPAGSLPGVSHQASSCPCEYCN